jgi:membrane protease YdiL (CAAX protease family)
MQRARLQLIDCNFRIASNRAGASNAMLRLGCILSEGVSLRMTRGWLVVEFLLIFVGLPLGYRLSPVHVPGMPLLWLTAGYGLVQLLRDARFDRTQLWNAGALRGRVVEILAVFLVFAFLLWRGVVWLAPQLEWSLIRLHPGQWAFVMVAYPVASVYPQGVIYRAFFFERYAALFPGKWIMILVSAMAFAFLHIIFRNWLAVELTYAGGLLFAWRYEKTKSLAVSGFEHALYACWLFTVGLGQYFYHGSIQVAGTVLRR